MFDQILKIEISAQTVAWYAAIVATISAFVILLNYLRDRPKIKIKYMNNAKILPPGSIHDPSKTYFNISVINRGRRAIRIETAALKIISKEGHFILTDSFLKNRIRVLTEEKPRTEFFVDQSLLDISKISYIVVYDGIGGKYKKYVQRFPSLRKIFRLSNKIDKI